MGAQAEKLARDGQIKEIHSAPPAADMDDFDRREKNSYVVLLDIEAFRGEHLPVLTGLGEHGVDSHAIIIVPAEAPTTPETRQHWAKFVYIFTYLIENFDDVVFSAEINH